MRIISGKAKGRRLFGPDKQKTIQTIRPTADRAKEALFNIIGEQVQKATVLDLFAGTGALGLEALSRGSSKAVFVDWQQQAITIIQRNVQLCGFSEVASILKRNLSKGLFFLDPLLQKDSFDLIFIDPPYRKGWSEPLLAEIVTKRILSKDGIAILEEDASATPPDEVGNLQCNDHRVYGDTAFWVYGWKFLPE